MENLRVVNHSDIENKKLQQAIKLAVKETACNQDDCSGCNGVHCNREVVVYEDNFENRRFITITVYGDSWNHSFQLYQRCYDYDYFMS